MTTQSTQTKAEKLRALQMYVPKLVTALHQGYQFSTLRHDVLAGLTVAIVALPLSMALGIASGTTPGNALITAMVAGFLISALGGSQFQVGGPTGAFVVVVYNVIEKHGYQGLVVATLMAGMILLIAGIARLGTWIKYIPGPVVTGFTAGIAVIIFSSQVKDLFGLSMVKVPADFLNKWQAFWDARYTMDFINTGIAVGSLALIVALKRWVPKAPGFLIAVVVASLVAYFAHLHIDTIGSRFGGIPNRLPIPALPHTTFQQMTALLPSAFTIAFLAGIESLLSAVVADGMTGRRHRSNCELVAQGVANIASALFGGIPATGAIARTATNIRSGARTPVAGILHAVFLLLFMLLFGRLASFIPLASLAAVLVIVAWNMSEGDKLVHLMAAPMGDRVVLLLTFGLTVLVDLTTAIEVGMVVAAILFMHRMAETSAIRNHLEWTDDEDEDFRAVERRKKPREGRRWNVPKDVEIFQMRGPLFFGTAHRLIDLLSGVVDMPREFILRMRDVPMMDATGVGALKSFIQRCNRAGCKVVLTELQYQPRTILAKMHIPDESMDAAIKYNFDIRKFTREPSNLAVVSS